MIIREMIDIRVPICKVCQGALDRKMVYRPNYAGHLYFCRDCGTEYKIIGQGQAENELEFEYERKRDDSKVLSYEEYPEFLKGKLYLGEPTKDNECDSCAKAWTNYCRCVCSYKPEKKLEEKKDDQTTT